VSHEIWVCISGGGGQRRFVEKGVCMEESIMDRGVCFEDGKESGEEGNRMAGRVLEIGRMLGGGNAMES
jgi:hypothetical protein